MEGWKDGRISYTVPSVRVFSCFPRKGQILTLPLSIRTRLSTGREFRFVCINKGKERTPQPRAGLTLDRSGHETTHVVTLQQQEQDQARDGHHHDASLRGTVVDGAHRLLPQVGHRERQGLLCAVG